MTHLYRNRKFFLVLILLLTSFAAGAPPAALAPVPTVSVDSITPTELRMHLEFLSSTELGGRYTLSPNFAIAARYLASHLEAYGFRGAGDNGSFLQHFNVISSKPDTEKSSLSITSNGQTTDYHVGDFYAYAEGGNGNGEGQIVFVGGSIFSPSHNRDSARPDVKGKVVLSTFAPSGTDRSELQRGIRAAYSWGAAGVLVIPSERFTAAVKNPNLKERYTMGENVRLAKTETVPALRLSPELADKLLASVGLSLKQVHDAEKNGTSFGSRALDASARFNVTFQQREITTQNVVGVLDGSDPKLKDEYVAFSAHYDHLQTNADGEIYPGADDDGSGTTAILTIAHAMSMDRPRRSVLIIFHAGEELGLLGSEYNTDYSPAVPLDKVVADLNIDMIGRSKPPGDKDKLDTHLTDANTVYLVGSDRISKELHKISEQTNAQYQKLKLDYYYNDPSDPERIYFRSDHWNYAKHGIPVIFYFDGTHVDYHKPTDTIDKIDFTKMTNVTRLVFETGWRLANLDHRLAKDVN